MSLHHIRPGYRGHMDVLGLEKSGLKETIHSLIICSDRDKIEIDKDKDI